MFGVTSILHPRTGCRSVPTRNIAHLASVRYHISRMRNPSLGMNSPTCGPAVEPAPYHHSPEVACSAACSSHAIPSVACPFWGVITHTPLVLFRLMPISACLPTSAVLCLHVSHTTSCCNCPHGYRTALCNQFEHILQPRCLVLAIGFGSDMQYHTPPA